MSKLITDLITYQQIIGTDLLTVVDFFAPWCGPCKIMDEYIKQIGKNYSGVVNFIKVNTDDISMNRIVIDNDIKSLPTFIFYRSGVQVGQMIGANKIKFTQLLDSYIRLSSQSN